MPWSICTSEIQRNVTFENNMVTFIQLIFIILKSVTEKLV